MTQKLLVKEKEHREFLQTESSTKRPEKPEIKVVHTLEPIENFGFMKRCQNYRENGKEVTVFIRPRNSRSVQA